MDNLDNIGPMIKKIVSNRELNTIIFTKEDNTDVEMEIIATFKNNNYKKIYYIMTDHTRSEKNELNVYYFYINYDENIDNETFYPVVDEKEINMVNDVFKQIQNNI